MQCTCKFCLFGLFIIILRTRFCLFHAYSNMPLVRSSKQLTADQRKQVRTLYFDSGNLYAAIQRITGYTKAQVGHAVRAVSATVLPRSGRPRTITPEQEEELIAFVCASKRNRRMCFLELSMCLFNAVFGMATIRNCLY
jgi:hypothetical protein